MDWSEAFAVEAKEMLEQIYRIQKDIGERISNVVLMGSGEPFDNTENVFRFLVFDLMRGRIKY